MHEDEGVLEHALHAVAVGDEVRREVAAVELHALDDVGGGLQTLGLFHRDDAFLADLIHALGEDGADLGVAVGGDGADGWAISWLDSQRREMPSSSATMAATALSMPPLRSIGLAPAATSLEPVLKTASASTVAVVVPSPATSEVLEATSLTI